MAGVPRYDTTTHMYTAELSHYFIPSAVLERLSGATGAFSHHVCDIIYGQAHGATTNWAVNPNPPFGRANVALALATHTHTRHKNAQRTAHFYDQTCARARTALCVYYVANKQKK